MRFTKSSLVILSSALAIAAFTVPAVGKNAAPPAKQML